MSVNTEFEQFCITNDLVVEEKRNCYIVHDMQAPGQRRLFIYKQKGKKIEDAIGTIQLWRKEYAQSVST